MATQAQVNYVTVLLEKAGADPADYELNLNIPHKLISGFIGSLKKGDAMSPEEWTALINEQNGSEAPVQSSEVAYDKTCFNGELAQIGSIFVKSFVRAMLEKVPDYFYVVPASSTGKYHPDFAQGNGGLVRHTKAALKVALSFFENPLLSPFNQDEKDIILASIMLHDSVKHGLIKQEYTVHEHPTLVEKLWDPAMVPTMTPEQQSIVDEIFGCIRSHMGPWTNSNYSSITLPKPETKLQRFVHMCDYIASKKWMSMGTTSTTSSNSHGF